LLRASLAFSSPFSAALNSDCTQHIHTEHARTHARYTH
jgi:hypothetical protein